MSSLSAQLLSHLGRFLEKAFGVLRIAGGWAEGGLALDEEVVEGEHRDFAKVLGDHAGQGRGKVLLALGGEVEGKLPAIGLEAVDAFGARLTDDLKVLGIKDMLEHSGITIAAAMLIAVDGHLAISGASLGNGLRKELLQVGLHQFKCCLREELALAADAKQAGIEVLGVDRNGLQVNEACASPLGRVGKGRLCQGDLICAGFNRQGELILCMPRYGSEPFGILRAKAVPEGMPIGPSMAEERGSTQDRLFKQGHAAAGGVELFGIGDGKLTRGPARFGRGDLFGQQVV